MSYDTVIRNAQIVDGSGAAIYRSDIAIAGDRIARIARRIDTPAARVVDAEGLHLAPGFIDVHTHDDLEVIQRPQMAAKVSQGITTVVVGNCGISASPVSLRGAPPDPLNLLGAGDDFSYPRFADYAAAVERARPNVNVGALIGHTSLRNNQMSSLDRSASEYELSAMCAQLREALLEGALGMSSGLAYANARHSDTSEVMALAIELGRLGGVYTTHLRTEFDRILEAMGEALVTAREGRVPLVVSHLKCAGRGNWGRSGEVLETLENAAAQQKVACDCYPYTASSSTLDLAQVAADADIFITWSEPFPGQGGRPLADIAQDWNLSLLQAAEKLQPAGAVYHCMSAEDVQNILSHPFTMVGSDGLPNDPHPHPRLWGAFPRVIAHYCRELKLFELPVAIHKMTGLSAREFNLAGRGEIKVGNYADLVLFDFERIESTADYRNPQRPATGIESVWVNGAVSYSDGSVQPARGGYLLSRSRY